MLKSESMLFDELRCQQMVNRSSLASATGIKVKKGYGKGPKLILRHEPRTAAAAAICVTDRVGVQPTRRSARHGPLSDLEGCG